MYTTETNKKERTLEEINEAFSHIPKYIVIKKGKSETDYKPFIFKLDNDHLCYAYVAGYCAYNKMANPNNHLFAVRGRNFVSCVNNLLDKIKQYQDEGKIENRQWHGEKFIVDFLNDDF